ncbi:MAG: extracellular solute-binding protein [bacterium]|nr:extracellular solute-binding protein [bacterium]
MKRTKVKGVVVGILSTILLAGCDQNIDAVENTNSTANNPVELTVWGAPEDQELLTMMAESFKQHYAEEQELNIVVSPQNESECKTVIFDNANEVADVFAFADDQLMELAAGGVLEPITNSEQITAENSAGSVEAASINGTMYAYPMTADNGYFMFYNKKYFSEKQVETLDGMLAVAANNKKKITMDFTSGWYLYSFFGNTGLSLGLNEDSITNYCDWNAKKGEIKGVDVGNAMLDIAKNAGFSSQGDDGLIAGAEDGSVIAGVSGVWSANALQKAWGNDYAAVKLPTYTCAGKQVQMSSYAGYKLLGVNAYSENKEWAMKLAEWITKEENQMLRFNERGQGPSNNNAAASKEVEASSAIQALIEQSEFSNLQRVGGSYWDAIKAFGQEVADKQVSPSTMQKRMDAMVKAITAKVTD